MLEFLARIWETYQANRIVIWAFIGYVLGLGLLILSLGALALGILTRHFKVPYKSKRKKEYKELRFRP